MTHRQSQAGRGRLQLLILAVIFFGPLAVAGWLFYGQDWRPADTTNNGELLDPAPRIADLKFTPIGADAAESLRGYWTLLYIERDGCDETCRDTLIKIRQIRLAAGRDIDRVQRLYAGAELPDASWLEAGHKGLIATQVDAMPDLAEPLAALGTGLYLVDPVGQVMMGYPLDVDSKPLYDDLHRLLKLTR